MSPINNTSMMKSSIMDDFSVPISMKGHFFQDDFFRHSRERFLSAMQNVMSQWNHDVSESMLNNELHNRSLFDSYRNLRLKDVREENQAVTVTKEGNAHKIVMDVKDFQGENLSVKVVGDCELIVEGNQNKASEGSSSSHKFRRSFKFPGLQCDQISAVLSADGVFTINAPVIESQAISGFKIPICVRDSTNKASPEDTVTTSKTATDNESSKHSNSCTEATNMSSEQESALSSQRKSSLNSNDSFYESMLPLSLKGSFFQDSFFDNYRQNFLSSINDVVHKSSPDTEATSGDNFSFYRNLRQKAPKEENQASTVTEDKHSYKLILDIHDYLEGEVKVTVLNRDELIITGEIKGKNSLCKQNSFRRSFALRNMGRKESISAVVSNDGILTIIVPKITDKGNNQGIRVKENKLDECIERKTVKEPEATTPQNKPNEQPKQVDQPIESSVNVKNIVNTESSPLSSSKENNTRRFQYLPIKPMGKFFHDSSFDKDHENFLGSVRNVLKEWGVPSVSDDINSYRLLRGQKSTEENQAVTFNEQESSHKIMLDVEGFASDELKVKVVGNDHLVVEGNSEKKDGQSRSSHNFKRHFYLPGLINVSEITSAISSDGVLTIVVPKMKTTKKHKEFIIPVDVDERCQTQNTTQSNSSRTQTVGSEQATTEETSNKQVSSDSLSNRAKVIQINKESASNLHQQAKKSEKNVCITQESSSNSEVRDISSESQNISVSSPTTSIPSPPVQNIIGTESCEKKQVRNDLQECTTSSNVKASNLSDGTSISNFHNRNMSLPIALKGSFFDDSFFNEVQNDYRKAVSEILQSWNKASLDLNCMDAYRTFRTNDLRDDNQAISISEDKDCHKIVVDVEAFKSGNVSVRAVSSNELIVEGHMDESKESKVSKGSFKRCFFLPGAIDMKSVTSAMSSDGVLTIIAPKMKSSIQQLGEDGNTAELETANINKGKGSTWQEQHEESSEGNGYSSRTVSKTFHSQYTS